MFRTPPSWVGCCVAVLATGCFDGESTKGLPCEDDASCGPGVSCKNGYCGGEPAVTAAETGSTTDDGPKVRIGGRTITVVGLGTQGVPGVLVSLADNPGVSAVSGPEGGFVLEGVPAGEPAFLVAGDSAQYFGSIAGVDVMFADIEGVDLPLVTQLNVQQMQDTLEMQDPNVDYDPERGLVAALPDSLGTTVTFDPPAMLGSFFALDQDGVAVLNSATAQYFWLPIVVFFNVDIGPAGQISVSGEHPTRTCVAPLDSPPTLPRHFSFVAITCA